MILEKDASEPNYHKFQFYTKTMQFTKKEEFWEAISKGSMNAHTGNYFLLIDREIQTKN